jgi:chemotaxis protein CheD
MKNVESAQIMQDSETNRRGADRRGDRQIIVGVGDLKVTNLPQAILATYALGSCVGVSVYDPLAQVGGLLHCQLPAASMNLTRAAERPGLFADSGLNALLQSVIAMGGQKRRLQVKLAGGAQMLGDEPLFNIGRRNYAAVRKVLWQEGLLIASEDVGGTIPRTMFVHMDDGSVFIKSGPQTSQL